MMKYIPCTIEEEREMLESIGIKDFNELIDAFNKEQTNSKVIIAHTVKGKGVSFMENKLEWHYKSPSETEYKKALQELEIDEQ